MELFELKNYEVTFSPQALALKPFKALWSRDRSKNKTRAIAELSYIYYMEDFKSDFADILDEGERSAEIKSYLKLPDDWKKDSKIEDACTFYRERSETLLTRLFKNIITGVDNLGETFKNIDPTLLDDKGKPVYSLSQLVQAAKGIAPLVATLREAEQEVKKEKSALKDNNKGNRTKSIFEDDI